MTSNAATTLHPEGYRIDLAFLIDLNRWQSQLQLPVRHLARAPQSGEWRTRQRGRGIDFDQVRPYQPGDDIRSLDWRVTARRQAPHTKLYREERERPLLLAVDLRSPMFFGSRFCFKSVQAATLAAALAWSGLARRDRVGGWLFGDHDQLDIRPKRSRKTLLTLLSQLAERVNRLDSPIPKANAIPLYDQLQALLRSTHPGSALVLISDFHDFDNRCEPLLFQLARHNDLYLLAVSDPLEQALPEDSRLWVGDGRRRARLDQLDTLTLPLPQRWRALSALCQRLALPLLPVSTADAPLERLQQLQGLGRRR